MIALVILGFSSCSAKDPDPFLTPDQRKVVDCINGGGKAVFDIVDGVWSFHQCDEVYDA